MNLKNIIHYYLLIMTLLLVEDYVNKDYYIYLNINNINERYDLVEKFQNNNIYDLLKPDLKNIRY